MRGCEAVTQESLARATQRENRKVREIAAEVVDGARRRARSARHQW